MINYPKYDFENWKGFYSEIEKLIPNKNKISIVERSRVRIAL